MAGTKDSEGFFGDFLGIYIFDFEKYISFTAEVIVDDKTICSGTVCLSMLELIDLRLSMDDCTGAERNHSIAKQNARVVGRWLTQEH